MGKDLMGKRMLASSVRYKKVFVSMKKEQDTIKITKGNITRTFLEIKKIITEKRKLQKKP